MVSWKSPGQSEEEIKERLFVSKKSPLDGSKPVRRDTGVIISFTSNSQIRGGIPIVFPIFGPPARPEHAKLAQHGFARSTVWKWDDIVMDNETGVSIRLSEPGLIHSDAS